MSRIYVCGPLSGPDREANVQAAVGAGIALYEAGHTPYIPHLTHYVDVHALAQGVEIPYETWIETDLEWLSLCQGLLWLGSSPGADRERAYAEATGIPVYLGVAEIPSAEIRSALVSRGARGGAFGRKDQS